MKKRKPLSGPDLPLPNFKVGAEKTLSDLVPYLAGEGLFSEKSTLPLSLTFPRESGVPD